MPCSLDPVILYPPLLFNKLVPLSFSNLNFHVTFSRKLPDVPTTSPMCSSDAALITLIMTLISQWGCGLLSESLCVLLAMVSLELA